MSIPAKEAEDAKQHGGQTRGRGVCTPLAPPIGLVTGYCIQPVTRIMLLSRSCPERDRWLLASGGCLAIMVVWQAEDPHGGGLARWA